MKKLLVLLLVGVLLISAVACSSPSNNNTPTEQPQETQSPEPTVEPTEEPTAEPTEEPTAEPEPAGWTPVVTEVPDEAKVASYAEAFRGDKEQGPVWFYLSDDGTGVKELFYTPNWGDNWQYSEVPEADGVYFSLFDWEGLKASAGLWGADNIKVAIAWRAYQDGTAKIGEWDFSAGNGEDGLATFVPGAVVSIVKGDEVLFTGTTTEAGGDTFEGAEVEVKEGDLIFFWFDGKDAPNANYNVENLTVELN